MRFIHIGLLCVQENVADRPNMASVVLMINSNSIAITTPTQPASFMRSNVLPATSLQQDIGSNDINNSSSKEYEERGLCFVVFMCIAMKETISLTIAPCRCASKHFRLVNFVLDSGLSSMVGMDRYQIGVRELKLYICVYW
ncbi:cysteine-rich receptor-like protein kinase 26 [Quercus suber]|uniref:Cysteine-rich receptor-like protein kinase 26 n=1 Tax=Quercus suber TaxID=58331 RepID=A0AAW0LH25_QUESU